MPSLHDDISYLVGQMRWHDQESFGHFVRTLKDSIPKEKHNEVALALLRCACGSMRFECGICAEQITGR